jgi:hypothetical protein
MVTAEQIASLVAAYIDQQPHAYRDQWGGGVTWVGPRPDVEQLRDGLLSQAERDALALGNLLRTPEGEVIAAGVAMVIPPAYAFDFKLFVDALTLASRGQQRLGRDRAGKFALAVLVAALLLAAFGGNAS